ncbi:hypothetical protein N9H39_02195 [Gammaproteobacteria bacterium]|nr:hypothetical protein [Gammaproteobacteria bacterium]
MLYFLTIAIYGAVFVFSVEFYSTRLGARAIYGGPTAIVIDVLAIIAGAYAIYFSYLSYVQGVGAVPVLATTTIGSVVSAMHLAKWIVRNRTGLPAH